MLGYFFSNALMTSSVSWARASAPHQVARMVTGLSPSLGADPVLLPEQAVSASESETTAPIATRLKGLGFMCLSCS